MLKGRLQGSKGWDFLVAASWPGSTGCSRRNGLQTSCHQLRNHTSIGTCDSFERCRIVRLTYSSHCFLDKYHQWIDIQQLLHTSKPFWRLSAVSLQVWENWDIIHSMDWLKGKPTGNHRFSHGFSYDIWVLKGSQGVSCNFSLKPIHSWMVVWNHGILWLSIYWECHHPNWRTHIFQRGRYTTKQPCHGILTSSYAELLRIGWDVLQSMAWQWKWPRKSTNAMCNRDVCRLMSFIMVVVITVYYPWLPLLLFFSSSFLLLLILIMTIIFVISILKLIKWEKQNTYTTSERRSRCARRISKWAPSWCTASVPCFLGKVLINRKPKQTVDWNQMESMKWLG